MMLKLFPIVLWDSKCKYTLCSKSIITFHNNQPLRSLNWKKQLRSVTKEIKFNHF
jgi:hypothetical protein